MITFSANISCFLLVIAEVKPRWLRLLLGWVTAHYRPYFEMVFTRAELLQLTFTVNKNAFYILNLEYYRDFSQPDLK